MNKNRGILHKNNNASNIIFNILYFVGIFYLFLLVSPNEMIDRKKNKCIFNDNKTFLCLKYVYI